MYAAVQSEEPTQFFSVWKTTSNTEELLQAKQIIPLVSDSEDELISALNSRNLPVLGMPRVCKMLWGHSVMVSKYPIAESLDDLKICMPVGGACYVGSLNAKVAINMGFIFKETCNEFTALEYNPAKVIRRNKTVAGMGAAAIRRGDVAWDVLDGFINWLVDSLYDIISDVTFSQWKVFCSPRGRMRKVRYVIKLIAILFEISPKFRRASAEHRKKLELYLPGLLKSKNKDYVELGNWLVKLKRSRK